MKSLISETMTASVLLACLSIFFSADSHAEVYFYCFSEPREQRFYITKVWSVEDTIYAGDILSHYQSYMSDRYSVAPYHSTCLSEFKVQNPEEQARMRRDWKIEAARKRGKAVTNVNFSYDGKGW